MELQAKRDLTVAVLAISIAAVAVAVLVAVGILSFDGGDDRPPVVVSSGSVEIEAMFDDKDQSKGTFNNVSGHKIWRHDHPAKAPKKFSVVVSGSTSPKAVCQSMQIHTDFKKLTFTYGVGEAQKQFTAEIKLDTNNQWGLQFDFQEDVLPVAGATAKLSIPGATEIKVNLNGESCDFGPHGRVELRQRGK